MALEKWWDWFRPSGFLLSLGNFTGAFAIKRRGLGGGGGYLSWNSFPLLGSFLGSNHWFSASTLEGTTKHVESKAMKWRGKRKTKTKRRVELNLAFEGGWFPKKIERQFLPFRSSLDIYICICICIYYMYIHTPFVFFCSMLSSCILCWFYRWQAHHDCRWGGGHDVSEPRSLYQSLRKMYRYIYHRIHGTGIYTYMNWLIFMVNVGIYHTWILWVLNENLFTP